MKAQINQALQKVDGLIACAKNQPDWEWANGTIIENIGAAKGALEKSMTKFMKDFVLMPVQDIKKMYSCGDIIASVSEAKAVILDNVKCLNYAVDELVTMQSSRAALKKRRKS